MGLSSLSGLERGEFEPCGHHADNEIIRVVRGSLLALEEHTDDDGRPDRYRRANPPSVKWNAAVLASFIGQLPGGGGGRH